MGGGPGVGTEILIGRVWEEEQISYSVSASSQTLPISTSVPALFFLFPNPTEVLIGRVWEEEE